MKPITVAMIIQAYLPHVGGAERQLAALAPLLRERGVTVHVLTRRYEGLAAYEEIGGVPVHRLAIRGHKVVKSAMFSLGALRLLRRLRPDVIHAHELLSPTTTAVLAKRWLGVPVVAKVLRGGELGDIAKLRTRPTGMRRFDQFREQVDAFIAISKEIDAELAGLDVPLERRPFIPNGVDTARFTPVAAERKLALRGELGLPHGRVAVFTGRLSPEKRVDQLVAVWPQVREVYNDAHLLVLGTGPEEDMLRARAGEGVIFVGRQADVVPYLQAADVFVLPSATEGLSNALLEGMATGLAVMATDVGGAPDLIQQGRNGWLIRPDEPAALLEGLLALFGAEDGAELGRLARERVLADYGLTAVADKLRRLYDRLLS